MSEEKNTTGDTQSFAEALAQSFQQEELEIGQLITGSVMAVHGDIALISVGGKSEAVMDRTELGELHPGDGLDAVIIALSPELRVSHRLAIERREREALRGAFANAVPVEGKVTGRNKGGYDVSIAGLRAFCPMSQIDFGFPRNVDAFLGKTFLFRITELSEDLDSMVVSRAQVLKDEREAAARQAWSRVAAGAELDGTVKSIRDFGVFVDLGGVDGMVHISELTHRVGARPSHVVKVGDEVRVKVLEADREKNRIALSMKALEPDPWAEVPGRFPSGALFEGTIARKTDFGIFVELLPGVDGLIHVSQLPPGMKLDDASLAAGSPVRGWVRECDLERRRLSLTLREVATSDPWLDASSRYPAGTAVEGTVERTANFGVFVQLEPGLTGLIPASETDVPKGGDLGAGFPAGGRISATVLSVDPERKRISLSVKKAKEGRAVKEFHKWAEERKQERKPEVTAFGAALMKALNDNN
ncbi:MAG TPA: S1 RNA-binding domain-containing protein [Thermoanaerobaculaceae bacterium]|nr:S1 RNA-binding domain-containing protein [Thermoanaerobaculaceae bacterium]